MRSFTLKRTTKACLAAMLASTIIIAPAQAQQLEEIVLTSRKVSESLQDVPIAVTAVTGASLDARGATNIADVASITPSLEIDPTASISGSSAATTTFLRGIGITDFLLTIDPGVGLYVDDVYVARSVGGLVDLLDVERVEVLKGPQGTLFGRNTIGGAVSIISKDPGEEFGGSVGTTIGTDGRFDVRANFSVPFSDRWLSSFSFSSKTQDGYGERLAPPEGFVPVSIPPGTAPEVFGNGELFGNDDLLGEINQQAARAKFLYKGDDFQARLAFGVSRARETAPPATLLGFTETFGTGAALADAHNALAVPAGSLPFGPELITGDPFTTFGLAPSQSDYDLFGTALTLNWQLNDNIEVKSITSFRDLESAFARDGDNGPQVIDHTRNEYQHEQFTQENQLTGTAADDRLTWLAGLYYFQEEGLDVVQVPLGVEIDLVLAGAPGTVINLFLQNANEIRNTSIAAFAQATYRFNDKFSGTLGIRRTEDEKEYRPTHVTLGINPIELLIDDALAEFEDTSPRVSIDYRWNDSVFTYASYSEGFKSGGFTGRTVDPQEEARPFEPEEAQTFEVGAKLDFNGLRINTALFTTDYTNLQLINQEGITPITVNAGSSTINGLEIELLARLADGLNLRAGYSYIDAEYDEITDPNATTDINDEFPNTPENSFNISLDYNIDLSNGGLLLLHADYNWKDDHFNDAVNTPLLFQEAFGLLGASATYTGPNDRWSVTAGVTNITDEIFLFSGFSQPGVGFIEGTFDRGREWFLNAKYNF